MTPQDPDPIGKIIDMTAARQERTMAQWMAGLQRSDKGILPTLANALILLANDPAIKGMLAYDEFASTHLITRAPPVPEDNARALPGPYPRTWTASDAAFIQGYLQRLWCPRFAERVTEQAMMAAAEINRFHPVRDWLDSLVWDGKPRLDTWLIAAFGCEDTPYHRAVGAKICIAGVRRVRVPGVKFDYLPVLEGAQGIGKSRAVKRLFGAQWFSDALPLDLASRDAALGLLGVWGIELGEIDQLVRTEVETVKAFLSRSTDRYRPPYGRNYVDRPRQGILIGTTNQNDYLRDATGNRRFWPVACVTADETWIELMRDQLWAEAAMREASGEPLWLEDDDIRDGAVVQQKERMLEDVWEKPVFRYIEARRHTTTSDVLTDALEIPKDRQDRRMQMRVAGILKGAGWKQSVEYSNGKAARIWRDVAAKEVHGMPF